MKKYICLMGLALLIHGIALGTPLLEPAANEDFSILKEPSCMAEFNEKTLNATLLAAQQAYDKQRVKEAENLAESIAPCYRTAYLGANVAKERDPKSSGFHLLGVSMSQAYGKLLLLMGQIKEDKGRAKEAGHYYAARVELESKSNLHDWLGFAFACDRLLSLRTQEGKIRYAEAEKVAEQCHQQLFANQDQMDQLAQAHLANLTYNLASLKAALGKNDAALTRLEEALELDPEVINQAAEDKSFKELSKDKRFKQLLQKYQEIE